MVVFGRISAVLSVFALTAFALPEAIAEAKPPTKVAAKHKSAKGKWRPKARAKAGGYAKHVQSWHATDTEARAPVDAAGRPKLVLEAINVREKVELEASSESGEFSESERARAARVLRDTGRDQQTEIDPRLLDLLYSIQRHFDAPAIRVISAFRAPRRKSGSRHAQGQAADIVVPGVKDHQVFSYVQAMHATGAGLYPKSGFVHVDVRESSTSWVDHSGPGQTSHAKAKRRAKRARPKKPTAAKK